MYVHIYVCVLLLIKCILNSEIRQNLRIVSREIMLFNPLILQIKIKKNNMILLKSPRKCVAELRLETRSLDFWFNFFPLLFLTCVSHFAVKDCMVQCNINSQIIFLIWGV